MLTTLKIRFSSLFILIGSIMFFSCGNAGNNQNSVVEKTVSAYDSSQGKSYTYTKYELPLSLDVYKFLKSKKIAFNILLMHKLRDQGKYFTDYRRAFVLGVFSSDLAYASIYEQSQEAVNYFGASIELAHKLDIQDGYNSNTLDRAYNNLNNEDSLSSIASESYWKTCSSLEKNKRNNILPMIVLGSWVESMHILTRNCVGSQSESGLFEELYQQKEHLDKMIKYMTDALNGMETEDSKTELEKVVNRLILINQKFVAIDTTNSSELGLDQFKEVMFQIEDLRNSMLE